VWLRREEREIDRQRCTILKRDERGRKPRSGKKEGRKKKKSSRSISWPL